MLLEPNCRKRRCKHYQGIENLGSEATEVPTCKAFPGGIPEQVAYGELLHLNPISGDQGIQFEKV